MLTWIFVSAIIVTVVSSDSAGNWGYRRGMNFSSPDQWAHIPGSSCGGHRQSPINIVRKDSMYWSQLRPITVSRGHNTSGVTLQTSATSMSLNFRDNHTMTLGGDGCLRPISIHWHWGTRNDQGSEHTVDGVQYDMEGHIVTYNCALYGTASSAKKAPNGLYVFSVLYKIGNVNPTIKKLEKHIDDVRSRKKVPMLEIYPSEFLPTDLGAYYRYEGSLTTPPCTENVVWTVFDEIQTLSQDQIQKFRSLRNGPPEVGAMGDNFRPVQSLDGSVRLVRPHVFVSFKGAVMEMYHLSSVTLSLISTRWLML